MEYILKKNSLSSYIQYENTVQFEPDNSIFFFLLYNVYVNNFKHLSTKS